MLTPHPRALLHLAYAEHFAMPAFNVCNLEMAKAVVEAAVAERAPVIVQTYPGDLAHAGFGQGLGPLPGLIQALRPRRPCRSSSTWTTAPVSSTTCAVCAGYNSVMFDGHDLPLDEALAETAAIARAAHALNATVEGELGTFGEGQGSHELTRPEEVPLMFERGHADMLAVSVGSEHGRSTRLQLDLLREIAERAQAPLVLHGGSGIHEDDVRAAMKFGVVKINIGAALARAWCAGSAPGSRCCLIAGAGTAWTDGCQRTGAIRFSPACGAMSPEAWSDLPALLSSTWHLACTAAPAGGRRRNFREVDLP